MSDQVVVITGASSGIGAALAAQLAARGDKVVLGARREQELSQVAGSIGAHAVAVVTDVTRRKDVERLRDRALEKYSHIDVWVNNAGRGIGRKVLELSDQDIEEMLAVNLLSAIYGMQAVVPHFQTRGEGHLINVSSFLSRVPFATYRSIYSASKSALNMLTAQLRLDLARDYPNIHVSLVIPGFVATPFAQSALWGTPAPTPATGPQGSQTADEVASAIIGLIEHPVPELYTNPGSAETARRYSQDVVTFEASMSAPHRPPQAER